MLPEAAAASATALYNVGIYVGKNGTRRHTAPTLVMTDFPNRYGNLHVEITEPRTRARSWDV